MVPNMHQAPELAVDSRVRPSHYKPHVEREMEEIASMPAFKAQPVKCGSITPLLRACFCLGSNFAISEHTLGNRHLQKVLLGHLPGPAWL